MNKRRLPSFHTLLGCILFAAFTLNVMGQEAAEPASTGGTSLFDLIRQGGWAMYPLGFLMLAMFYLIFHCWSQTGKKRFVSESALQPIASQLGSGNLDQAKASLGSQDNVLSRLMTLCLVKVRMDHPTKNREGIEASFVEAAEGEENSISQWINYLNVIATVAPMVGLLGTVSGMIGAFQKIGQGGMGKPEELAGNIGEALITTATGLVIGIPAMVAYFYFRNRLTSNMIHVGQTAGVLIDRLEMGEKELSGEIRAGR